MNVLLVSHCNFAGASAFHVRAVGTELTALGFACVMAVPDRLDLVDVHGRPPFAVHDHATVLRDGVVFPDGRGPDLVHAWTPREHVRGVVESVLARHGCPYLVHLEDNERAILEDALHVPMAELLRLPGPVLDEVVDVHLSHPRRAQAFLEGSIGATALMDRLLEDAPADKPGLVFWPGFDEAFRDPPRTVQEAARARLSKGDRVLVYTGNVHHSNAGEVRSLYLAVALLRRRGHQLKLLKTGWNTPGVAWTEGADPAELVIELGFIERSELPSLLALADVLVQPGTADRFNDYRFPSKLPEFLASGKPVVLPRTNIGRFLRDGEECLLLDDGHAIEIADKVERLLGDAALAKRLGEGGRAFALRELTWKGNVAKIAAFYRELAGAAPAMPRDTRGRDPEPAELPLRVIALGAGGRTDDVQGTHARRAGLTGSCTPLRWTRDSDPERFLRDALPMLRRQTGRVAGGVLVVIEGADELGDPAATTERWRRIGREEGIGELHLCAIEGAHPSDPRLLGLDAVVEAPRGASYHDRARTALARPLTTYPLYRTVTVPSSAFPDASEDTYQRWLAGVIEQSLEGGPAAEPVVFVAGSIEAPALTARGVASGIAAHHRRKWLPMTVEGVARAYGITSALPARKTSGWLDDEALSDVAERYRAYPVAALSYATVKDYCDSADHLRGLAKASGDLKDVQRPWTLKALLSVLPPRARVLEVGAGEPFVADLLSRLGHEVWVVDPYDGSGNGPVEHERYRRECPDLRFVRAQFQGDLAELVPASFDAIYSISVLEHVPAEALPGVFAGLHRFLKPGGHSIHAVDHVHRGAGAEEHLAKLRVLARHLAPPGVDLDALFARMDRDTETYYLSAEAHDRWRGSIPYDQFPMRVCVSVQLFASVGDLLRPDGSTT